MIATVITGSVADRPAGFPCFECGVQVREERVLRVEWPDGTVTYEPLCASCGGDR